MEYKSVQPISRNDAMEELSSGNSKRICQSLLALVLHENDYDWLLELCVKHLEHEDCDVQAVAIQSLGHLARLYGKMDKKTVTPMLEKLKKIDKLSGIIEDTFDDISMFTVQ